MTFVYYYIKQYWDTESRHRLR